MLIDPQADQLKIQRCNSWQTEQRKNMQKRIANGFNVNIKSPIFVLFSDLDGVD